MLLDLSPWRSPAPEDTSPQVRILTLLASLPLLHKGPRLVPARQHRDMGLDEAAFGDGQRAASDVAAHAATRSALDLLGGNEVPVHLPFHDHARPFDRALDLSGRVDPDQALDVNVPLEKASDPDTVLAL